MDRRAAVAVIGAGFSGALTALHLLRALPPDAWIALIERSEGFGRGVAFAASSPSHLLNVRVSNMSAFPDEPAHLWEWLRRREPAPVAADSFITRATYGDYVGSLIDAEAGGASAARLQLLGDEAIGVSRSPHGVDLKLASGSRLSARALVLAIGAPPVRSMFDALAALPASLHARDPWSAEALSGLDPLGLVVLVGSGLTMADTALALWDQGHRGPILAISRRGLAPRTHAHVAAAATGDRPSRLEGLAGLVRRVRGRADQVGWRLAVDELRPFAQDLWREAPPEQRRRFLRHLRPWWDAHRHRLAPAVARRIDGMRAAGQLRIAAGRIVGARARSADAVLAWRPRGQRAVETLEAVRVIDCTGFSGFEVAGAPALRGLVEAGLARADALGLGLDVDDHCRLIGAGGAADDALRAVGPLTRGAFWEIVAVPDIRNQVASVAADLARALRAAGARQTV